MPPKINHVCFVDDDPDDHLFFAYALKEFSPLVILDEFYRCDALIDYLNDEDKPLPDIIFLDLNMPGESGSQCLKVIKNTSEISHIPVIIYSTSDYDLDKTESYQSGAYRYIVKPVTLQEIKNTIKQVILEYEGGS